MSDQYCSFWNGKKSVLLVDDHPFVRSGMSQFIATQPDLAVVGEAGNPREAMELIERLQPDLLLTDLSLPGKGGLELIKDVRALYPKIVVLVVSMYDEPIFTERALLAGARGYLVKTKGAEELLLAMRQVLRGRIYISEEMSAHIVEHFAGHGEMPTTTPISRLTDRELEIFTLLGRACASREIANEFGISIKTVETHLGNMKQKLGVGSLRELSRLAVCWLEERRQVREDASVASRPLQ
jgi:DNA-binding NarL/FixJ family response regulator